MSQRQAGDAFTGNAGDTGWWDNSMTIGGIHHVEIWVADFEAASKSWGWLLGQLGYSVSQEWTDGRSFRLDDAYIVLERSADLSADGHDRRRPGLNHVAFHAGDRENVDRLASEAIDHGWVLLFTDRHPYAGGETHYAAYLENDEGFEVELCARLKPWTPPGPTIGDPVPWWNDWRWRPSSV